MLRIVLKETRAAQLRRELDNAVNGTDYGSSIEQADSDSTVARAKGLEVDEPKQHFNFGEDWEEYGHDYSTELFHSEEEPREVTYYPNGRLRQIISNPNSLIERIVEFYKNGKVKSIAFSEENQYETEVGPSYIEYDEIGNVIARKFTFEGENSYSFGEWAEAKYERYDGYADRTSARAVLDVERDRRLAALKEYSAISSEVRLDPTDLREPPEEYSFTKNRQKPPDPRFAGLDLTDNQPPQKTEDKELGNRAQGLEVEPPKERDTYRFSKNRKPPSDPRFKGLELDEKLNLIRKEFKKLL